MKDNKLIRIYIINRIFHWLIIGMTIPVITMILLDKGLDFLQVGLVFSIQSAIVIIFELPSGALSDTIGRKKVYIISIILMFICSNIFLFSDEFTLIVLVFIVNGISQALSSGTIDAWFVDKFNEQYPEDSLQKFLARAQMFTLISLALSSVIGGVLPMTLGKIINYHLGLGIYSGNFVIQIVLIIIHIILTEILIKDKNPICKNNFNIGIKKLPNILKESIKQGVQNKYIFLMLITAIAWGIGFCGLEAFWQPKVKSIVGLEKGDTILGLLNGGYFFAGAIGSYFAEHVCRLLENKLTKVLIVLRIALGLFFVILSLQNSILGFTICYLLLYSVNGMSESPYYTMFNNEVKEGNRATLLSLESLFMKFGGMLGSIVIGYISREHSISFGWVISGILLILSSLAFLKLYKLEKQKLNNNILG